MKNLFFFCNGLPIDNVKALFKKRKKERKMIGNDIFLFKIKCDGISYPKPSATYIKVAETGPLALGAN